MRSNKENRFDINFINENLIKIEAKCNTKNIRETNELKESGIMASFNSLMLSNTICSNNTNRISKNSLFCSNNLFNSQSQNDKTNLITVQMDSPNRSIRKLDDSQIKTQENLDLSKFKINENKKMIKGKKLKLEISKINNFVGETDSRDTSKLLQINESIIQDPNHSIINKIDETFDQNEISKKSIFFTPSTICNYYQQSYIDSSAKKNLQGKNLDEALNSANQENNGKIILINSGRSSSKLTPTQIKYTKVQLQSEGNKKKDLSQFDNIVIGNTFMFDNDKNNFTLNNVTSQMDDEKKGEKVDIKDLVKEIKKEVLDYSEIENDISKQVQEHTEKDSCKKNLNLNFLNISLESEKRTLQTCENLNIEINSSCSFLCVNEIRISIDPTPKFSSREKIKGKNLSDVNFVIQRQEIPNNSLEENMISIIEKQISNNPPKIKATPILPKAKIRKNQSINNESYHRLLGKTSNSQQKSLHKIVEYSVRSQSKKSHSQSKGKVPEKNPTVRNIMTNFAVQQNILNKNFVKKEKIPKKSLSKNSFNENTPFSPTYIQTTSATLNSNYKPSPKNLDSKKSNSKLNIINNKKKDYLEMLKYVSENKINSSHRNKNSQSSDVNKEKTMIRNTELGQDQTSRSKLQTITSDRINSCNSNRNKTKDTQNSAKRVIQNNPGISKERKESSNCHILKNIQKGTNLIRYNPPANNITQFIHVQKEMNNNQKNSKKSVEKQKSSEKNRYIKNFSQYKMKTNKEVKENRNQVISKKVNIVAGDEDSIEGDEI